MRIKQTLIIQFYHLIPFNIYFHVKRLVVIIICPEHAQGVNNSAQIIKHVLFRLDFLNCGAFDKLLKDTYNYAMGYLRKARRNKIEEQCHWTLLNLVLEVRLRETVRFICDKEKGGVFQPEKFAEDHTGTINETVT